MHFMVHNPFAIIVQKCPARLNLMVEFFEIWCLTLWVYLLGCQINHTRDTNGRQLLPHGLSAFLRCQFMAPLNFRVKVAWVLMKILLRSSSKWFQSFMRLVNFVPPIAGWARSSLLVAGNQVTRDAEAVGAFTGGMRSMGPGQWSIGGKRKKSKWFHFRNSKPGNHDRHHEWGRVRRRKMTIEERMFRPPDFYGLGSNMQEPSKVVEMDSFVL